MGEAGTIQPASFFSGLVKEQADAAVANAPRYC